MHSIYNYLNSIWESDDSAGKESASNAGDTGDSVQSPEQEYPLEKETYILLAIVSNLEVIKSKQQGVHRSQPNTKPFFIYRT